MTSLTYEFRVDPSETVRASQYIRRRQRFGWLRWAVWPMLLGLAVLYRATDVPWRDLWLLGVAALFLAALTLATPWVQRRQLQRAYSETPSLREPQVYRFSDAGLAITGGPATVTLGWDAIVEALETPEFFLLFYSKRCAYYVPKRSIGGIAEEEALRVLLREHLGTRAAGLRPA